ncbi:TraG family conjugative transposon ATPase [Chondrinema litorale]|uniref:TraG family conjugative transposon ATPase n=1 Tax=Chondrinema litorale TaxID=2994555 RepID=UPI0025436D91|nr:TraG family conjugative transposon ATPase [Chondrinema litorale]UZS00013.1 TraG family conjugative transposon ATPase [Chondrinema litorale]
MLKKEQFKSPYIGIDTVKYSTVYTKNGDYSVIINCINPILQYAADMEAYYNFHSIYSNIIKILGAGFTIQKQDIITKQQFVGKPSDDFLSNKYNENFTGREFNHITTNLIITKNVKRTSFYKFNYHEFETFNLNVEKVFDILNANHLQPKILDEKELKNYIKRMISFNFVDAKFSFNNIRGTEKEIYFGDSVVKSVSLVDVDEVNLPTSAKPYKNVNDLGFSFPVDLMGFLHDIPEFETIVYNQVVSIPDQQGELSKLNRKKQRHESMPDPANDVSVADISGLMADVAKNGQLLVYSHFNIAVKCHPENTNTITNFIESALFNAGVTPSKNAYNQLELFRTCLPGNTSELKVYDKYLTTSDAAICFFFKERLLTDEKSKFQIFFSDRQGIPVAVDTSDLPIQTNRINNRNKFVLGPSGSGKSFFMNHLVRQYFLHNMDVVLVDTGHSYSGLCAYYGGKYITYEENNPITMNPFRISIKEYNEEKREFVKSLIGLIWKGAAANLNQIEDTILYTVVESYFTEFFSQTNPDSSQLCFNNFYDYSVIKIKEIIDKEGVKFDLKEYSFVLKRFYKGGQFDTILNDDVDASLFDESLIVFEIDAIKEHKVLFPITTIIIMDVFLQKMRHKKNRKALIIEEAWKAIASPMMAGYILYLYKTVRKFWGETTVVTQELDDIISNSIVKDSIINNSDTICLLDQTKFKDNYSQVSKLLSLNEIERKKIFTINNLNNKQGRGRFKEVYIKRGATGEVYGVEVSMYEYLTFTTERKEKEAVQSYVKEKGGFMQGLESFVNDLKQSKLSLSDFVDEVNSRFLIA